MKPDSHAGPNGCYHIHSIYFDNPDDKALREKINGVALREKWRVRWYNDDLGHVMLEKKIKHNELCLKLSAPLTEQECRALAAGEDAAFLPDIVRDLLQCGTVRQQAFSKYGACRKFG